MKQPKGKKQAKHPAHTLGGTGKKPPRRGSGKGAGTGAGGKLVRQGPGHPAHRAAAQFQAPHHAPAHHLPRAKAKKPAAKRGLAFAGDVPCCAAEAVITALCGPVRPQDVLALHRYAGGAGNAGVPILAALDAAAALWPVSFAAVDLDDPAAVVLGVDLPGAHTVCADPGGGWWSWGALWCPCEWPEAVIEEAWTVTWS